MLLKSFMSWQPLVTCVRNHSQRASIGKIGRSTYTRMYPTLLVLPDGATVNIRYHNPRAIIKLPFDVTTLSDEERKIRLLKRQPKVVRKIEDDLDDDFSIKDYSHLWKKK